MFHDLQLSSILRLEKVAKFPILCSSSSKKKSKIMLNIYLLTGTLTGAADHMRLSWKVKFCHSAMLIPLTRNLS